MGIDADFFQPEAGAAEPGLVVGAGNDRHRDHELLVKVVTEVQRRRPTARPELASRLPVEVPPAIGRRRTGVHVRDVAAMCRDATVVAVLTKPNLHASGVTVALEAMASGRAVVATDTPGLAEYVVQGETGLLVPAGEHSAAAEAIEGPARGARARACAG
jgi:glycosyltransferase involved in cell wall biosynthesis